MTHILNETFEGMPEDVKIQQGMFRKAVFDLARSIGADTPWKEEKLDFLRGKILSCVRRGKYQEGMTNCESGQKKLSIDYDGNIYACHSSHWKIATIDEPLEVIREKFMKAFARKLPQKCMECPVLDFCLGGCPIAPRNADGTFKMCSVYKEYYEACLDVFEDGILDLDYLKRNC